MTSIAPYLKKMDQEIMRLRQEIAIRQLEIHKIEESRLTIMGIEQRSTAAPDAPLAGTLLNGTSYDQRPAIVARPAFPGDEEGTASRAAKTGNPPKMRKRNAVRYRQDRSPLRARIWDWFKGHPEQAITSTTMIDQLDMRAEAQLVYHALGEMKRNGDLTKDAEGNYRLAPAAVPRTASGKRAPRRNPVSMRQRLRDFLADKKEPLFARDIIAGMGIDKESLDDKLLGQSLSAMKVSGQLRTHGEKPFRYSLAPEQ